jgi:class 3 adenylate cyclase
MGSTETVNAKYIYLDIVNYSFNRSVEAQTDIIGTLNDIVRKSVESFEIDENNLIFIPTGDGICTALLDSNNPFDVHIEVSLKILKLVKDNNDSQEDDMRKFEVRIGVNENIDNLILDINGSKNVAGAGINKAQRIMNNADGGNILIGHTVYEQLSQREKYFNRFRKYSIKVKHNIDMELYQFVDSSIEHLNSEFPKAFKVKKPIFSKLIAYLIGHIVKNKDFILKHRGNGWNNAALFVLMISLAKDSIGFSESSEFKPYKSQLPIKGGNLEDNFNYLMNVHYWINYNFREIFQRTEVWPYWDYFVLGTDYLQITSEGLEKLKREYPNIIKELE